MEKSPEQCEAEFKEAKEETAWRAFRDMLVKYTGDIQRPAYLIAEFNEDGTFSRGGNTRIVSGPEGIKKLNQTVDEIFEESRERHARTSEA